MGYDSRVLEELACGVGGLNAAGRRPNEILDCFRRGVRGGPLCLEETSLQKNCGTSQPRMSENFCRSSSRKASLDRPCSPNLAHSVNAHKARYARCRRQFQDNKPVEEDYGWRWRASSLTKGVQDTTPTPRPLPA